VSCVKKWESKTKQFSERLQEYCKFLQISDRGDMGAQNYFNILT